MPELNFWVVHQNISANEELDLEGEVNAVWIKQGSATLNDRVLEAEAGTLVVHKAHILAGSEGCNIVRLIIAREKPALDAGSQLLASSLLNVNEPKALFRFDQVTFPPGATAWRHVHPGPGYRHLIKGKLHLEADDHSQSVLPGDCWFEAANSPVKARADEKIPQTAFIRLMMLPTEFEGKPTIQILSEEDKKRERLQTTHRFAEVVAEV